MSPVPGDRPRANTGRGSVATLTRTRPTAEQHVVQSQVEPRIVERRRSVEREARRARRRLLIAAVSLVGLVAATVGATMSPLLDVDRITVVGQEHVTEAEVVAASGVEHGDRLVDLDVDEVRDELSSMPWIASARVVRDWPDAVRISVTEERAAATLVAPDTMVLVSTTGRVLEQVAAPVEGRPRLESAAALDLGPDPVGAKLSDELRYTLAVFERIPDDLALELGLARVADDGTLSFELPDATIVHFGPPEDVAAKLLAVQAVLSQVVRDCMATLDVREPARPAVSRGPGCPGISPESTPPAGAPSGSSGTSAGDGSGATGTSTGTTTGSPSGTSGTSAGATDGRGGSHENGTPDR